MSSPNDRKYTSSHEWVKIDGNQATVGLTLFAVNAIKDVVFLELPQSGKAVESMKPFGVIESVKAVFDLNCPVAGTISQVNSAMMDDFDTLTKDSYEKGWLIKLDVQSPDQSHLMDSAAYDKFCAEDHH